MGGRAKKVNAVFMAVVALQLSGCHPGSVVLGTAAAMSSLSMPEARTPITISDDETLFFGRIVIMADGQPLVPYSRALIWSAVPPSLEPGKGYSTLTTEPDGAFYYVFPKGDYALHSLMSASFRGVSYALLSFPPNKGAKAVYVGTVEFDVATEGLWLSRKLSRVNSVDVRDEFEVAKANLIARHPNIPQEAIGKGLLTRTRGKSPIYVRDGS